MKDHHGYGTNANRAEAYCWCEPFMMHQVDPDSPNAAQCPPLFFHRPDPGMVFWDRGEQGPQLHEWYIDAMWPLTKGRPRGR